MWTWTSSTCRRTIACHLVQLPSRTVSTVRFSTGLPVASSRGTNPALPTTSRHQMDASSSAAAALPASEDGSQNVLQHRTSKLRYIDIGINLSDPVFRGVYHGRQCHDDDLADVIQRAVDAGCLKFMITGSDLTESTKAIDIAKAHPGKCYATVGVHPCASTSFDKHDGGPAALLAAIRELAQRGASSGHVVAFGEIGLDYDRLHFASKETQLKYFAEQLDVAVDLHLPLFLHSRAASADFEKLLNERLGQLPRRGLVHSFTGTLEEMHRVVAMGFHVGVNGCSLKTEENLEVVKAIPLDRLQLETDGPWCEIRPSHAGYQYVRDLPPLPKAVKKEKFVKGCMIKGRNEPVAISRVAHAVAQIKGIPLEELCEAAWANSTRMFGLGESETNGIAPNS